jgi:hypothetical protein
MRMLSRSREPVTAQPRLDWSHDVVAHPLGLGQRQAGRQRRAGERPALGRCDVLGERHAVVAQQAVDRSRSRGRISLKMMSWLGIRIGLQRNRLDDLP